MEPLQLGNEYKEERLEPTNSRACGDILPDSQDMHVGDNQYQHFDHHGVQVDHQYFP